MLIRSSAGDDPLSDARILLPLVKKYEELSAIADKYNITGMKELAARKKELLNDAAI